MKHAAMKLWDVKIDLCNGWREVPSVKVKLQGSLFGNPVCCQFAVQDALLLVQGCLLLKALKV